MLRGGGGGGITEGTTPIVGGSNQQVQFNDNGVLNGDAGMTYDKSTPQLSVGNLQSNGVVKVGTAIQFSNGSNGIITGLAGPAMQFGNTDVDTNASIVAQTLRSQGALTGGTTNQAGKNWTFIASPGKGTGAGGNYIFQVAPAGGSGSTPNTPVTALTLGAATAYVQPGAGTTAFAPLQYTSGTNLTTAQAGAREYDGAQHYATIDTTSGRGAIPVEQYFRLNANGSNITTIANFFGTTSNISLVASAFYLIEIELWWVSTGALTATWTLTNSAAPTSQNIYYETSPVGGIVAPPGTATELTSQVFNDTTTAKTLTQAPTGASNNYARIKIILKNGTGTSLQIQATASANAITPGIGSMWRCRRISPNNIGTFAA